MPYSLSISHSSHGRSHSLSISLPLKHHRPKFSASHRLSKRSPSPIKLSFTLNLIAGPRSHRLCSMLLFKFFFWNFRRLKIFSLSPWDVCFNFLVGVFYLNYGSQPKYISILVMLIVSPATRMNIHFRFYAFVKLPCIWMFIFIFMLLLMVFWVMNLYYLTWRSKGKTFFFSAVDLLENFQIQKLGPNLAGPNGACGAHGARRGQVRAPGKKSI